MDAPICADIYQSNARMPIAHETGKASKTRRQYSYYVKKWPSSSMSGNKSAEDYENIDYMIYNARRPRI